MLDSDGTGALTDPCGLPLQAKGEIPEDVLETQVDPAAFEMCGHIVLKRDQDYDAVTQVRRLC